ncbi:MULTISPECIES: MliC family protein [Pseudoalteromonas]|uniref:MliC family protein n=1 Tax=Pseudoalteromonas undina TaxID=43660 RepID=A0ACC6R6W5_9GAMM|nr:MULTISPECIES: MliC family protein [unclassified Pseudoalteromonas]KPZ54096.1 Membrane-bound lysozyme-inhibitor of c-type lysozyme [Pseudoalteromonas sp. P1-25]KPZ55105.1 Membrane-bound lysozyme-inhibitor of c-type lysozyme [Pseudoalteromonas sp. P1-13-1a]
MRALVVIFTSMLILSACSDEPKSTHYLCNDRVVELAHQGARATLTLNQQTYTLNKEPSASGVKYINERVLFWSKADEAMLIVSGNKYHCQQQADAL